jgi:SAM-dependent methyltransferase
MENQAGLLRPIQWSSSMDTVFRDLVLLPVRKNPATDMDRNVLLGFPYDVIRKEVIEVGLTNFDSGHYDPLHGSLTPNEKVLLYCFINMKGRFFSTYNNFRTNLMRLKRLIDGGSHLVFIDVGCGPATACLALCDLIKTQEFLYFGIDLSETMREMARAFWDAAVNKGLIDTSAATIFEHSWLSFPAKQIKKRSSVLLNFSYFFASHSLTQDDIDSLANLVRDLVDNDHIQDLLVSYTNSGFEHANQKYVKFKKQLGARWAKSEPEVSNIVYRKKPGRKETGNVTFVSEFLDLKG